MKNLLTVVLLIVLSGITLKLKAEDNLKVISFEKGQITGVVRPVAENPEKFLPVQIRISKGVPYSITQDNILSMMNTEKKELVTSTEDLLGGYSKYYTTFFINKKISKIYLLGDTIYYNTQFIPTKKKSLHLIFGLISIVFMLVANFFRKNSTIVFLFGFAAFFAFTFTFTFVASFAAFFAFTFGFVASFAAIYALLAFATLDNKQIILSSGTFYICMITSMGLSILGI